MLLLVSVCWGRRARGKTDHGVPVRRHDSPVLEQQPEDVGLHVHCRKGEGNERANGSVFVGEDAIDRTSEWKVDRPHRQFLSTNSVAASLISRARSSLPLRPSGVPMKNVEMSVK